MANVILVTGGARSGKSRYAQELCEQICAAPVYLATAQKWDGDFEERIKKHQGDRGECWTTVEETQQLSKHAAVFKGRVVLVDCLTLWLTNFFLAEGALSLPREGKDAAAGEDAAAADRAVAKAEAEFSALVSQWDATFVFVSNEVGSGVHPEARMTRRFVDGLGRLNQHVATTAHRVVLLLAGVPSILKAPPDPCSPPPPLSPQQRLQAQLLDHTLSARAVEMEPEGYFLLGVDKKARTLTASFYSSILDAQGRVCDLKGHPIPCHAGSAAPALKTWAARTAKEMAVEIFERWEECPVKRLHHAAYIGREVQRAEHCLFNGLDYVQD